jgi:hypothetical protein
MVFSPAVPNNVTVTKNISATVKKDLVMSSHFISMSIIILYIMRYVLIEYHIYLSVISYCPSFILLMSSPTSKLDFSKNLKKLLQPYYIWNKSVYLCH